LLPELPERRYAMSTISEPARRPGRPPNRLAPPRRERLQVAFSADERTRLDEQARADGYETIAAFIRARTLGVAPQGNEGGQR